MPIVIAVTAVLFPPLGILLCGKRKQAAASLVLYVVWIVFTRFSVPRLVEGFNPAIFGIALLPGLVLLVWVFMVVRGYDAERRAQKTVDAGTQEG